MNFEVLYKWHLWCWDRDETLEWRYWKSETFKKCLENKTFEIDNTTLVCCNYQYPSNIYIILDKYGYLDLHYPTCSSTLFQQCETVLSASNHTKQNINSINDCQLQAQTKHYSVVLRIHSRVWNLRVILPKLCLRIFYMVNYA